MQYFKSEESFYYKMTMDERAKTDLLREQNIKAYLKRFSLLSNRISKNVYNNLLKNEFHDFILKDIKISRANTCKDIEVALVITNREDTWQIKYKKIKSIHLNFDSVPEYLLNFGIDLWGYHELLDFDENTLSHEILFASGSTVKILFKNNNIFIDKIN